MGVAWQDIKSDHNHFKGQPIFEFQFGAYYNLDDFELDPVLLGNDDPLFGTDSSGGEFCVVNALTYQGITGDYVYRGASVGTGYGAHMDYFTGNENATGVVPGLSKWLPIYFVGSAAFPVGVFGEFIRGTLVTYTTDDNYTPSQRSCVTYSFPYMRSIYTGDRPFTAQKSPSDPYLYANTYLEGLKVWSPSGPIFATQFDVFEGSERNTSSASIYTPFSQVCYFDMKGPQNLKNFYGCDSFFFVLPYKYWYGKCTFAKSYNYVPGDSSLYGGVVYSTPSLYELINQVESPFHKELQFWNQMLARDNGVHGVMLFNSNLAYQSWSFDHDHHWYTHHRGAFKDCPLAYNVLDNYSYNESAEAEELHTIALRDLGLLATPVDFDGNSLSTLVFSSDRGRTDSWDYSEYYIEDSIWKYPQNILSPTSGYFDKIYTKNSYHFIGESSSDPSSTEDIFSTFRMAVSQRNRTSMTLSSGFSVLLGGAFQNRSKTLHRLFYWGSGDFAYDDEMFGTEVGLCPTNICNLPGYYGFEVTRLYPTVQYHIGQEGACVEWILQRNASGVYKYGWFFFEKGSSYHYDDGQVYHYFHYPRARVIIPTQYGYPWDEDVSPDVDRTLSLFSGGNDYEYDTSLHDDSPYCGALYGIPLSVTKYHYPTIQSTSVFVSALGFESVKSEEDTDNTDRWYFMQGSQGSQIHKYYVQLFDTSSEFIASNHVTSYGVNHHVPVLGNFETPASDEAYITETTTNSNARIRKHGSTVALNIKSRKSNDLFVVAANLDEESAFTSKHYMVGHWDWSANRTIADADHAEWELDGLGFDTYKYFRSMPQAMSTPCVNLEGGYGSFYSNLVYFIEQGSMLLWKGEYSESEGTLAFTALNTRFPVATGVNWNNIPLLVDTLSRNGLEDSDKTVISGIASTSPWYWTQDDEASYNPAWTYDVFYSNRVLIADFTGLNVWDAISLLAQKVNHLVGFNNDIFYMIPNSLFYYDGFSPEYEFHHEIADITLNDGVDEIANKCSVSPGVIKQPEMKTTYVFSSERDNPNLSISASQTDDSAYNVRLYCVKSGVPDPAIEYDEDGAPIIPEETYSSYASYRYKIFSADIETSTASLVATDATILYLTSQVENIQIGDEIDVNYTENRQEGVVVVFTGTGRINKTPDNDDIAAGRIYLTEALTWTPGEGSYTPSLSNIPIGSSVTIKDASGTWSNSYPNVFRNGEVTDWSKTGDVLSVAGFRKFGSSEWMIEEGGENRGGYSLRVSGEGTGTDETQKPVLGFHSVSGSQNRIMDEEDATLTEDVPYLLSFWVKIHSGIEHWAACIRHQADSGGGTWDDPAHYLIQKSNLNVDWGYSSDDAFAAAYDAGTIEEGKWYKFEYIWTVPSGTVDPAVGIQFYAKDPSVDFSVEKFQICLGQTSRQKQVDITYFGQKVQVPDTELFFSVNAETNKNVQNILADKDYLDIQSTGNVIEVDSKSVQSSFDLDSREDYGLKEYTYPDNRFVTFGEAADLAQRRVLEDAFPRYRITLKFNTLVPQLRFVRNKNRNKIKVISPKYFSTSINAARVGVIRSITHDFNRKTTSVLLKDVESH